MDSAAEFLFGVSVNSLSDTLPLPHNLDSLKSLENTGKAPKKSFITAFSESFSQAQVTISFRNRVGPLWPLTEFWKDKTSDQMKIINSLLVPIVEDALKKKREMGLKLEGVGDPIGDTLLTHLVQQTDGMFWPFLMICKGSRPTRFFATLSPGFFFIFGV